MGLTNMWLFKWAVIAACIFLGITKMALGDPLDSWPTWSVAQPYVSKQVPPYALIMRGIGTDAYYVPEVDPTTGAIPVSLSGGSITIDYSGATGAAVPADAAFVGGRDGSGNLRGLEVDASGELQIDVLSSALPSGASTSANQTTANSSLSTIVTNTGRIPAQGQALMAASTPVVIASNQSAVPVSQSGTWTVTTSSFPTTATTNAGSADASTLRVSSASRVYSDSARQDYSSVNVTTGAWTQLIASTAAAINSLCITDQSGQIMELGTGAAASETRVFLIARGWSGCIPLRVAAATRVAVRAVSATASSGDLVISGMN